MKKLSKEQYENFVSELLPSQWKFSWAEYIISSGIDANGICKFSEKVIKVVYNVKHHEDLTRTIIHELAHVFVGQEHGHDKVFWKMYQNMIQINWTFIHCPPGLGIMNWKESSALEVGLYKNKINGENHD